MQENLLKSSDLMDNITGLTAIQSNLSMSKEFYITESNITHINEFLRRNIDHGAFDAPRMEHALSLIRDIFHSIISHETQDCTVLDNMLLLKSLIYILKLSSDATTASFSSFYSCKCYEHILRILNNESLLVNIIKHDLLPDFNEIMSNAIKVDIFFYLYYNHHYSKFNIIGI